ncbi:MAG: hypothetical protein R2911_27565 [Caldilineaceae bacterium]
MNDEQIKLKVNWYRTPLERQTLAALNRRSDWTGLLQTGSHLGFSR